MNHAIRTEKCHTIHYDAGGEELDDMASDPNQWTNLASSQSHTEIKRRLKKWLPKTNAPHFRGLER